MKRTSAISNRQWQWAVLAVALLALVILFPPYDWSFVGDDFVQFRYVWEYVDRPFTAITLFNPYTLPWYYRPIQNWWFLANRLTFGFNPFPYYAILGIFHALVICLIYRTSRQLRLSPFASFVAAALFAIHAHWVDVVGWLSSVAIVLAAVFNLAAVSAYLKYLKTQRESGEQKLAIKWLGLTAVFFLFALITHEEGFLLPILLLIIRRLEIEDGGFRSEATEQENKEKLRITHYALRYYELTFFVGMFLLTAVYLYTQFTRPNLTLAADEIGLSGYLSHINVGEIIRFLTDSLAHFTLAFGLLNVTSGTMTTISLGIISLLMLAYFYGSRIVQIGLSWLLLHMAFIYFALWTQKPELFAGRHIYQAGLGLVWAIGAGVGWWERRWAADEKEKWRRNKNRKRSFPPLRSSVPLFLRYMPLLLLTAVILSQLNITHNTQASWLHRAERYRQAEAQVKRLLPVVNSNTTVFAHSFPITPSFLPATFQVWYETTINTAVGGSLPQLQKAGQATSDYYLFDYRDEAVVNLMPELQEHSETRFLWAQDGRLEQISPDGQTTPSSDADLNPIIAGPENDLRVSIMSPPAETADTWNSIIYPATIPANSQLQLSLLAPAANTNFRVRLLGDGSEWVTLLETAEPTLGQWTDITIPLNDYWQQTVILRLESKGAGMWGNPRFTLDMP